MSPGDVATTLPVVVEAIVAALVVAAGFFAFVGSLGLAKLPDTFMRLHGPSKASTLGIGCALVASAVWFTVNGQSLSLHEGLISAFLAITAPISAHLLAKAALHRRLKPSAGDPPAG